MTQEKQQDMGASAKADRAAGLRPQPPAASSQSSIPSAEDFIRAALTTEIAAMLEELGQPPLVERIFPNGWRNADRRGLTDLYELCRRTFAKRGQG